MNLHLFRSGKEPDMFGFTPDATGADLPAELAPWTRSGEGVAQQAWPIEGARYIQFAPIFDAVGHDGYYVGLSEIIPRK
jgi:hypothetical protein